jgi:5-methylcytosine-specific restriction enzyme A
MDNKRFLGKLIDAKLLPKDENGNICCRFCNKGVLPPRRVICSPECEHEIKIRVNSNYMRKAVYKRDKGICRICNLDTPKIAKEAMKLSDDTRQSFLDNYNIGSKRKIWKVKNGGGLWDADHILPVKEGGGLCGLDNIRTLCINCHKNVTKDAYHK